MLPGSQAELQKHAINVILILLDARMQQYIHYFFKKKVVNLSKTKKAELKWIMSPLLEHHHALMQITADIVADMFTGDAATPSSDSVEEV